MAQQMIAILLGLYILGEAIAAASLMEGGDKLSRLIKYLLIVIVGLWLIFNSRQVDTLHLAMAAAIALFLWPKLIKRIDNFIFQHIGG